MYRCTNVCAIASAARFVKPNVELTGRQRQDARPGPQTMYSVPAAWAWWPAGGAPVERKVRPHSEVLMLCLETDHFALSFHS